MGAITDPREHPDFESLDKKDQEDLVRKYVFIKSMTDPNWTSQFGEVDARKQMMAQGKRNLEQTGAGYHTVAGENGPLPMELSGSNPISSMLGNTDPGQLRDALTYAAKAAPAAGGVLASGGSAIPAIGAGMLKAGIDSTVDKYSGQSPQLNFRDLLSALPGGGGMAGQAALQGGGGALAAILNNLTVNKPDPNKPNVPVPPQENPWMAGAGGAVLGSLLGGLSNRGSVNSARLGAQSQLQDAASQLDQGASPVATKLTLKVPENLTQAQEALDSLKGKLAQVPESGARPVTKAELGELRGKLVQVQSQTPEDFTKAFPPGLGQNYQKEYLAKFASQKAQAITAIKDQIEAALGSPLDKAVGEGLQRRIVIMEDKVQKLGAAHELMVNRYQQAAQAGVERTRAEVLDKLKDQPALLDVSKMRDILGKTSDEKGQLQLFNGISPEDFDAAFGAGKHKLLATLTDHLETLQNDTGIRSFVTKGANAIVMSIDGSSKYAKMAGATGAIAAGYEAFAHPSIAVGLAGAGTAYGGSKLLLALPMDKLANSPVAMKLLERGPDIIKKAGMPAFLMMLDKIGAKPIPQPNKTPAAVTE